MTVLFVGSAAASDRPVVLVLGDSLSAGYGIDLEQTWVALLETQLNNQGYGYRVINASISGDTTGNGLRRLPRALDIHQPDIVIVELGGNDGLRGYPVEIVQDNLESIILKSQESGAKVVLAGILIPPNYGQEYGDEFAAMYPTLAKKYSLPLVPFFMDGVALDPSKMQPDGIHPNADAQPMLLDNVWRVMEPTLKSRKTTVAR